MFWPPCAGERSGAELNALPPLGMVGVGLPGAVLRAALALSVPLGLPSSYSLKENSPGKGRARPMLKSPTKPVEFRSGQRQL